ncbi:hypothetical protein EAF04_004760 [Stromatinia cepivora]|nr:hypothetical protein EAF04_004760 [Stromatinia cepivora]
MAPRAWTPAETAYLQKLFQDKHDEGGFWRDSKQARKKLTKEMNKKFSSDDRNRIFFVRHMGERLTRWVEAHPRPARVEEQLESDMGEENDADEESGTEEDSEGGDEGGNEGATGGATEGQDERQTRPRGRRE